MFQEQVFKSRIQIYSENKPNYFKPSNELSLSFNLAAHLFFYEQHVQLAPQQAKVLRIVPFIAIAKQSQGNDFTFSSHLYGFV